MSKKRDWMSLYIPKAWLLTKYDTVSTYRFGAEAGAYAGYQLAVANALIGVGTEKTDKIVTSADRVHTLKKKGCEDLRISAVTLVELFSNLEEKAAAPVDEPLPPLPDAIGRIVDGVWEECDLPEVKGRSILKAAETNAFIVVSENDYEIDDDLNAVLTDAKKRQIASEFVHSYSKIFYATEEDAVLYMVGGESKILELADPAEAQEIYDAYQQRVYGTDREAWDTLPTLDEFIKDRTRERNWKKCQAYKNDKAYEKNTPYVLRDKEIFVCWKYVYYDQDGNPLQKPAKVPFSAKYEGRAKSNSRDGSHQETWATFDEACRAVDKYGYDGIGIMFGTGVCGVDIDGCIKDGVISDQAKDIIGRLNSYTEYSPSGTGVHILCFGSFPRGARNDDIGLEMYSEGRFFTLTGHRYGEQYKMAKKADSQPVLEELFRENFAADSSSPSAAKIVNPVGAPTEQTYSSAEIVKRICKSPRMGGKFKRLCQGLPPFVWDEEKQCYTQQIDGHFLKVTGEPDTSKLDFSFAKMLVFYRATAEQIDEIYRAQDNANPVEGLTVEGGGLAREKWSRNQGSVTYGQYVINNAYQGVSALYDTSTKKNGRSRKTTNANEAE